MPPSQPPELAIVEHFLDGDAPNVLETLTPEFAAHFAAFFQKSPLAQKDQQAVEANLVDLANASRWIVCKCAGDFNEKAPVMYPMRQSGGSARAATLVPMYERKEHASQCAMFKVRPKSISGLDIAKRARKKNGLGVLKALSSGGGAPTLTGAGSKGLARKLSGRMPSIARVLFTILDGAGVNVIGQVKPSPHEARKEIVNFLNTQFLDCDQKVQARPYFELSMLNLEGLKNRLVRNSKAFGSLAPHGFVIDFVKKYASVKGAHTLFCGKEKYDFNGRLIVPGENTPGPWLAIALVATPAQGNKPEILRAYLHPVSDSSEYVLVDSNLERSTLALLREFQAEMRSDNSPVQIIKPMLDVLVEKEAARPDFILDKEGTRVVVETMGYQNDDAYLEQKQRTHQTMLKLPGVISLHQHDGSGGELLKSTLRKLLS